MNNDDYYSILEISRQATAEELKKAYRRLAIRWHPDRNQGSAAAENRFKAVSEAYAVLSHPTRRRQYDVMGMIEFKKAYSTERIFHGFEPEDFFTSFGLPNVHDTLGRIMKNERLVESGEPPQRGVGDFFSGFGLRGGPMGRSPDLRLGLVLTFREAALGAEKDVPYSVEGKLLKLKVKVPPGAKDGQELVFQGQGPAKTGSRPGDLVVSLVVSPDPNFSRRGFDLETTLELSSKELIEGCRPVVADLSGRQFRLTVPPGTEPGTGFRLGGQGLPTDDGGRGALLVRVVLARSWS